MNVYQLKRLQDGIEIDNTDEYRKHIARFAWDRTPACCKILDNFVVIVNDGDGTADLKVICGPNQGKLYKNIDKCMLVKPSLLPCFMKDALKWQDAVNMIKSGSFPASVGRVCENALINKKERICAGFNQKGTRDSILSIKILEEVLTPYLGPLGLALVLNDLKKKVFNEDSNETQKKG